MALSCNKPPYKPDYVNAKGFVIGKETCNSDQQNEYWLIDFTYLQDTPQYGDTLTLNGVIYTNVVKTKGLSERLKEIGMRVSIDFKTITPTKVTTSGCDLSNPVTYGLKELYIINQFEIR
jgi:hypothetical protein